MANNTGFLLMAGLGALLFLGRGGATKTPDEDKRLLAGQRTAGPIPPAFDLQSYIDGLFGEMATAPVQPPVTFFYPPTVVVTSSGVPGTTKVAPEIITETTKVAIGGDGGETITASALAVRRSEQIAQQEFEAAANVQRRTAAVGEQYFWAASVEANRIEEERQKKFARDLIAKNIAAQLARTRIEQENINKNLNPAGAKQKGMRVISVTNAAYDASDAAPGSNAVAGQPIIVLGQDEFADPDFAEESFVSAPPAPSAPQYSQTFEISGGMDSPGFASEDEQYSPTTTVHEITAAYDIGF